jgi:hypothetical protein
MKLHSAYPLCGDEDIFLIGAFLVYFHMSGPGILKSFIFNNHLIHSCHYNVGFVHLHLRINYEWCIFIDSFSFGLKI